MGKNKILFLFVFMFFGGILNAQKTDQETDYALDFNDYCAEIIDSLYIYGLEWGELFEIAYETKNFSTLKLPTNKLYQFIQKSQKELIKRDVYSDMEDLKVSVLDFLTFEKVLILEAFRPFEQFTKQTRDDVIEAQLDILIEKASLEEEVLKEVRDQQERLGEVYGYRLE